MVVLLAGSRWVLLAGSPLGDDNSAHLAVALHIAALFQAGHSDLWWHQSNLGLPLFAAYQPLPALAMGATIAALQWLVAPVVLFKASILICWALMPAAWYQGARWYGLSTGTAVALGLLTLTVHDPYGIGFGIRSATHRGLYTQHFGLLFLPLFVGSFRRQVDGSGSGAMLPAALYALTAMSHLWVGLYAAIMAGTLLLSAPGRLWPRLRRAAPVGVVAAAMLAWWLVPLILTNSYAGGLPWRREIHNGWPWPATIVRLFTGSVFDAERLPLLTVLVGAGSVVLWRTRHRPAVRHWLLLTAATALLFLGRTNLGSVYDRLPLHGQVNVMRYLTGVHICGLIAAAAALAALSERSRSLLRRAHPAAVAAGGLGIVLLGAADIRSTLQVFDPGAQPFAGLVQHLSDQPDHRLAVHGALGTGSHLHRDLLPSLSGRGQLQSYAHGYHCTLSTYYAEYFDFSPAACGLFDVGSIVARQPLPADFPQDAYAEHWQNERYVVFHPGEDADLGVFSFIDLQGAIEGPDLRAIRQAVRFLAVPAFASGVLPRVGTHGEDTVTVTGAAGRARPWSVAEAPALLASLVPDSPAQHPAAVVRHTERGLSGYTAQVDVSGTAPRWLLLKVNMFPWWHATVGGQAVAIVHAAPNFMAVQVPPGTHEVVFDYRNPPLQKLGALISLLLLGAALATGVRTVSRGRRSPLPESAA